MTAINMLSVLAPSGRETCEKEQGNCASDSLLLEVVNLRYFTPHCNLKAQNNLSYSLFNSHLFPNHTQFFAGYLLPYFFYRCGLFIFIHLFTLVSISVGLFKNPNSINAKGKTRFNLSFVDLLQFRKVRLYYWPLGSTWSNFK